MQKKNIYLIAIIILLALILGGVYIMMHIIKPNTAANNSPKTASQSPSTKQSEDTILLATSKSLYIFTDANGKTLYHNLKDWPLSQKPPYNPYTKCTGACSITWPPFYTDNIKISPPLKASDFMEFTRPDGKKQIAYRGWPLYYYSGDNNPGDVNGQSIENIWYAGISPN